LGSINIFETDDNMKKAVSQQAENRKISVDLFGGSGPNSVKRSPESKMDNVNLLGETPPKVVALGANMQPSFNFNDPGMTGQFSNNTNFNNNANNINLNNCNVNMNVNMNKQQGNITNISAGQNINMPNNNNTMQANNNIRNMNNSFGGGMNQNNMGNNINLMGQNSNQMMGQNSNQMMGQNNNMWNANQQQNNPNKYAALDMIGNNGGVMYNNQFAYQQQMNMGMGGNNLNLQRNMSNNTNYSFNSNSSGGMKGNMNNNKNTSGMGMQNNISWN